MIATIAIPSILAFTYLVNEIQSDGNSQIIVREKNGNDNQIYEQTDSQTSEIEKDENFGVPVVTVQESTTNSGVNITVKEVMTKTFDPLTMARWDITTAMRAEQILKEETDAKFNKIKEQFTSGGLSIIYSECKDLQRWYQYYYFGGGRNLDGLWSYNQKTTDFLKQRMTDLGCSYYELPEGNKERLNAEQNEIQHAIQEIKDKQAYYDKLYGKVL